MDFEEKERKYELMKPEERANALSSETSVFLNVAKFEQMNRVATMLSKSDFIPERFRGHPGNCMVALDMASLMGMHPVMLMRTMYIVHGMPGFEGKFVSALINNSGRYVDPLEYEWQGESGKTNWGCRAYAVRKSTGKTVYGPWITWKMVIDEGWNKDKPYKNGRGVQKSKWNTMPELMFVYRAASYFGTKNDADLLMGMKTIEEIEDIEADLVKRPDGSFSMPSEQKPTNATYEVNAQAPRQQAQEPGTKPEEEKPSADKNSVAMDEFGTPMHSPFEKGKWFNLRAGNPSAGTGFGAYVAEHLDQMSTVSETTYNAMFEKWKKLYGKEFPYRPDGIASNIENGKGPVAPQLPDGPPDNEKISDGHPDLAKPPEAPHQPQQEATPLLETEAAKLLASMAGKHKREYVMVVKNRVPESIEQIYAWVDEINQLVVKHSQEKPEEQQAEQF